MKLRTLALLLGATGALLAAASIQEEKQFDETLRGNALATDSVDYSTLMQQYGNKKKLPKGYEKQALLALSQYPELKNIKIEFRLEAAISPLVSRPTELSTLVRSGKKRTYLVLISTETIEALQPILLSNMPFNSQVGVLGHELAHVADFADRNFFQMLRVTFGNLSDHYMASFETATDQRTILHGMGCQLLAWSSYSRKAMAKSVAQLGDKNIGNRYMTPEQIERYMQAAALPKCAE